MFGNTTSFRATIGPRTLPVVGAAGTGILSVSLPGVSPGDIAILAPAFDVVPLTVSGSCTVAGTLDITFVNASAAPSGGGLVNLGEATILRHTGSV
jgi:hypothetical protein